IDKETENQIHDKTRDLQHYEVYLDDVFIAETILSEYQFNMADLETDRLYSLGVKANYDGGDSDMITLVWDYVGIKPNEVVAVVTALKSNYPNPFNPETSINFSIKDVGYVKIEIFNAKGQRVKALVDVVMEAGNHSVIWDGKDESGKSVKSGVFFYRMKTGRYTSTKKMILLK
ncbi:MAG: T9SS type A sorting domain-containing protein, partial [Candidatus Cloacimonetes bacterium]|nr:T9SS type A sorting domain-containing protein [Candidatus Cloacimonadota bacterium]